MLYKWPFVQNPNVFFCERQKDRLHLKSWLLHLTQCPQSSFYAQVTLSHETAGLLSSTRLMGTVQPATQQTLHTGWQAACHLVIMTCVSGNFHAGSQGQVFAPRAFICKMDPYPHTLREHTLSCEGGKGWSSFSRADVRSSASLSGPVAPHWGHRRQTNWHYSVSTA